MKVYLGPRAIVGVQVALIRMGAVLMAVAAMDLNLITVVTLTVSASLLPVVENYK